MEVLVAFPKILEVVVVGTDALEVGLVPNILPLCAVFGVVLLNIDPCKVATLVVDALETNENVCEEGFSWETLVVCMLAVVVLTAVTAVEGVAMDKFKTTGAEVTD